MANKYVEKLDRALDYYLKECACLNLSELTVNNYRTSLYRFRNFWAAQGDIQSDPTAADIRAWRDSLNASGLAKTSIRQHLTRLKAFFEFCVEDEPAIFEHNPVTKKLFPKLTDEDRPEYDHVLTPDDLMKLWENKRPYNFPKKMWARNYAMVMLLLDGKIRNAELLNLRLSDIDFEYNEVRILGKGRKLRYVTLSDIAISAIKLYLKFGTRPDYCTDDDYLFGNTSSRGEFKANVRAGNEPWHQGTRQWLSDIVERHVEMITGKHGFRSHAMRHSGSVLDLNSGVRMERLQSELGHSSITTTEIYAGRLPSVRRSVGFQEAAKARDEWAKKNMEMLAG